MATDYDERTHGADHLRFPCPHQWQPIETAPKDGTWIVVWDTLIEQPRVTKALSWRMYDDESHWMPLPPLPVEEETDG